MENLFTSSGYTAFDRLVLENGLELELATLPPFLRVLLITDGTVTKSLESFFWEPVAVLKTLQHRVSLDRDLPSIEKHRGAEVIARDVRLEGEKSKTLYAFAHSYIRPEALPESIRLDLEHDKVGIGELLRECGLETYRELIRFGKETFRGEVLITRTYRIVMGQQPFIEITEKFPLSVF